jgi:hypothetical protein
MPRGGWRPGSGRKKGSTVKKKRRIAEEASALGVTPLAYMLGIMNDENAAEHRRDEMAWRSAPFCHPRLVTARHDVRSDTAETTNVYVEEITIVSVESGRFLSPQEASEPVVEILPDRPQLDAVASEIESESESEDAAQEGPQDAT